MTERDRDYKAKQPHSAGFPDLPQPLILVSDVRMGRGDGDVVYAHHPAGDYSNWLQYAHASGSLTVVARFVRSHQATASIASGPMVSFLSVPDYSTFKELAWALPSIIRTFAGRVPRTSIVMGRLPEPLSIVAGLTALARRQPFIANVVADPSAFGLEATTSKRVLMWILTRITRFIVRHSTAAIYVTEKYLQSRFPTKPTTPTLIRSNVRLTPDDFRTPRSLPPITPNEQRRLVLVGNNQTLGKGQDIAIETLVNLTPIGHYHLTIIGGGRYTARLLRLAADRGVRAYVDVRGEVTNRGELWKILDESDLFLLPSRSEGLPRAMIEAMARGLPCVASNVGGIPELLPEKSVIHSLDPRDFATAILLTLSDPERYAAASRQAIVTASRVSRLASEDRLTGFLHDALSRHETSKPWAPTQ